MKFQFKIQPFAGRVRYVRDYNVHIGLDIIKDESVHYYTISMTDVFD